MHVIILFFLYANKNVVYKKQILPKNNCLNYEYKMKYEMYYFIRLDK